MLFFILVVLAGTLWMHEMVHVQINRFDKIDSYFTFVPERIAFTTIAEQPIPKESYSMHAMNEAITYTVLPLALGIMGILVIGFVYLGEKIGKKEEES